MIVYKITNIINGKGYVGISRHSLHHRWSKHIEAARSGQLQFLYQAIRKYGVHSFTIEELQKATSFDELMALEKSFIKEHLTYFRNHGYNMTTGGEGVSGIPLTDERRAKLSKAASGKTQSTDTITKRAASIAAYRAIYGDDKRKEAARLALQTPQYRAAQSLRMRECLANAEIRLKLSNHMKSYRAIPEVRLKYSEMMRKRNARGNNQSTKTHCPNGHAYDSVNTYKNPKGWRRCRECGREECRRRRQRALYGSRQP